ncbi:MAG: radical SAM protein [Chloroflexota bacterium]
MASNTHLVLENQLEEGACHETDFGASGVLKSRLWRIAEERCIPLGATIEITLRCNLRCTHCYNFDRSVPYPKTLKAAELTPNEILSAIDQLAEAGCLYLSFSGGEALLHPHLDYFIRHARKRRMAVKVKSNGTLLTVQRVEKLVEAGALGVDISLYGATAETHDAFTERSGSFVQTIAGMENAQNAGLDVKVNICLVRSNVAEVADMIALVEGYGFPYGMTPFITARYDGTVSSLDHQIEQKTLETLYRGPLKGFVRQPDYSPNKSVQCMCARATCGISATGDVYPCIGAPVVSGNLRQQSFAEIWQHSPQLNEIRNLKLDDFITCKTCSDRPYCGRSSGVAYTNTGNYTGPEPFTCREAAIVRKIHLEEI